MSHTARDRRSSAALRKADKFAADNDGGKRVQAKQAISVCGSQCVMEIVFSAMHAAYRHIANACRWIEMYVCMRYMS